MKRIAIPIIDGKLSPFFGQCSHYQIFEINGKHISQKIMEIPLGIDVMKLPEWASLQGITDIIAFRIDQRILSRFINNKINLFVGVPMDSPQALIEDYLNGKLTSDEKIIREITKATT